MPDSPLVIQQIVEAQDDRSDRPLQPIGLDRLRADLHAAYPLSRYRTHAMAAQPFRPVNLNFHNRALLCVVTTPPHPLVSPDTGASRRYTCAHETGSPHY